MDAQALGGGPVTIACAAPDASLGVAIRLSAYLDCQARALGENGFQAIAGGPVAAGLLSGLVTIFVALIGYRLILDQTPDVRDGVSWAVRLGLVLALATSWPAFQTLFYRVAVDGPGELAGVLLPASGLPVDSLDERVQQAYDTLRLGSVAGQQVTNDQSNPAPAGNAQAGQPQSNGQQQQTAQSSLGQPALPQTASIFVITTTGVVAAFRVAIGFLLAIGPLAILGLLFEATLGVFSGWVRALAGAALALLAATIVTSIDLIVLESEFARLQTYARGMVSEVIDPQALTTIVLLFAIVMLVAVLAAVRVASAFRLQALSAIRLPAGDQAAGATTVLTAEAQLAAATSRTRSADTPGQERTTAVADALAAAVRREQGAAATSGANGSPQAPSRRVSIVEAASRSEPSATIARLGAAGRRSIGRRTRSAASRDRGA